MSDDYTKPDRDMGKGHPLLATRWLALRLALEGLGFSMFVNEVYRPELRQQWLYGAGRTVPMLVEKGISPHFARPMEKVVTNAWSARLSAHGYTMGVHPAAAALDVVPVGPDGRPWTKDDPWDHFVATMAGLGPSCGLAHFHSPGKAVWDKPHLQLFPEWHDAEHRLILTT